MVSKAAKQFFAFLMAMAMVFSMSIMTNAATVKIIQVWPYDLVDLGKHCDWDARSSKYHSYVVTATNKWNAYKPGVFRPDSLLVIQDVRISDVDKAGNGWTGQTDILFGTIKLNKAYLDSYTDNNNRLKCVMHELGHALGLDENASSTSNVMYPTNTNVVTLSANDKASYDAAYARY